MEDALATILSSQFLGNTGRQYTEALVIFLICIVALWIFKKIVLIELHRLSKKTATDLDDYAVKILQGLGWPFFIQISFNFSVRSLFLSPLVHNILNYALIFVVVYYAVKSVQLIIEVAADKYVKRAQVQDKDHDPSLIHVMTAILKICVWIVALLFILSNFGVNISALVAGLGIGGIAIAFALQNVLSDMFASFSIYFDKPFKIGDIIQVGTDTGRVKKIGIKSTRIETLQGQELIVSNKELTSTRINNYKKMEKRRVAFTFGVAYETPVKKIKGIPAIVRDIITKIKDVEIERVHFKQLGDSALVFEVAYFIKNPEVNPYMDAQQEINLQLMERFEKEGIEFAYPTQTVYLHKP